MATKSTPPAASDRKAKIQAAQKSQGSGANRIVVATVVVVVAIIAVVGGVVWSQSQKEAATGTSTAVPAGASMGKGYPAFADVTPAAGAPTVDLYEDFQCPICGQFEAELGPTFQDLASQGKVKLSYHGRTITVPVIDRGPYIAGREWDLTGATAELIGFNGLDFIDWTV